MSVLENSYTSEKDSPIRPKSHSLCQDLQQFGQNIENLQLSNSKPDIQSESCNDDSYIQPTGANVLQNEPELQINDKSQEQQQNEENCEGEDSSSPKTITLIEEDIASKQQSLNMSSKISQYSTEVDNQSFATFLSIRDTQYNWAVKHFEILFTNISNLIEERMKNLSQTYLSFFKLKYMQQKSYVAVNFGCTQNNRNHLIYLDCKTVADQIRNKLQMEKQARVQYVKTLQKITSKMQKHFQTSFLSLQNKKNKIIENYKKIAQIVNEMSDLMIPQNRKKQKKLITPEIYNNSFIRTKYLMSKQKSYLTYIAAYLQKVLTFISYYCFQLEPANCLLIKQSMIAYTEQMSNIQIENRKQLEKQMEKLTKTNCYEVTYRQLTQILEVCIPDPIQPKSFFFDSELTSQKRLKKIIESLISQSQSLVYIPVIQLEPKDYAYTSKNKANVKWIKVNHQQKYKTETIEEFETNVVLTHDCQLVLQILDDQDQGQSKMAIMKLKNIKLSRKNNKIFLTDKGSGMLGYLFSSNSVLGTLSFQPLGNVNDPLQLQSLIVDEFIEKVKDLMDDKQQKKFKK